MNSLDLDNITTNIHVNSAEKWTIVLGKDVDSNVVGKSNEFVASTRTVDVSGVVVWMFVDNSELSIV